MQLSSSRRTSSGKKINTFTLPGITVAIMFACGPFMFATVGGRGLFLYLAALFFLSIFIQAGFINAQRAFRFSASKELRNSIVTFCLCLFWQLFSFLWSAALSFNNVYAYIKVMLFFLLLSIPSYTKHDKKLMVFAQAFIVCIVNFVMITQGETIVEEGSERLTFSFFGVPQDPNYLAFLYIVPALTFWSIIISKQRHPILRILSGALLLFLLYGLLSTGSRGALIGIFVALIIYFIFQKKLVFWKAAFFIGVGCLLLGLLLTIGVKYLPESVAERFTLDNITESGGSNRTLIWQKYLETIFHDASIFFFGSGNSSGRTTLISSAHNYIIESWFDYGLIGLGGIALFFFNLIFSAWKKKNSFSFAIILGALAMAFFLSVGKMLQFWLCITIANILVLPCKAESPPESDKKIIE